MNTTDTSHLNSIDYLNRVGRYGLAYWNALVNQTRRYGQCYVHSRARSEADFPFRAFEADHNGRKVVYSFTGWGRSLQTSKGHKYKVHVRYADDGKPVPSKHLTNLRDLA
jgi:hypothetical protein